MAPSDSSNLRLAEDATGVLPSIANQNKEPSDIQMSESDSLEPYHEVAIAASPVATVSSTHEHLADTTTALSEVPRSNHGDVLSPQGDEEMRDTKDDEVAGIADGQTDTKNLLQTTAKDHLLNQTQAIVLPSYSAWFDMATVHDIERKAMSEFFNSRNRSKTQAVYKDYRDFMINTYRLNPSEFLTVTACRRNLAGDVCSIMRVHAFLEQWGLINYQVDAEQRPSHVGPPFTGHFKVTCDTPRGLQPWQPSVARSILTEGKLNPDTQHKITIAPAVVSAGLPDAMEIGRNIYEAKSTTVSLSTPPKSSEPKSSRHDAATEESSIKPTTPSENRNSTPTATTHCHQCGVDCTRAYYHHSVQKGGPKDKYELCPACYSDGRTQRQQDSAAFNRVENPDYSTLGGRDNDWSDIEILRLLEALERFDDDWNQIAVHVGTRSREECVLAFLQLDIDKPYLDSHARVDGTLPSVQTHDSPSTLDLVAELGRQGKGYVPLGRLENPVMSIVSFLSGLADPATTASAAQRSADELRLRLRQRLDLDKQGVSRFEPAKVASEADTMDVDDRIPSVRFGKANALLTTTTTTTTRTMEQSLTSLPLASMGARAAGLASNEEREMTRLVSTATNAMLQKINTKLKYFSEMETALQTERREAERERQLLFLDRLRFKRRILNFQDGFKSAMNIGGERGLTLASEAMAEVSRSWLKSPTPTIKALTTSSSDANIRTSTL
jgi:SWI/SNF related-matrix-associated actin-dependent regulator of chromatin subfamily C